MGYGKDELQKLATEREGGREGGMGGEREREMKKKIVRKESELLLRVCASFRNFFVKPFEICNLRKREGINGNIYEFMGDEILEAQMIQNLNLSVN